ncbi:hypothetical protein [Streptomyces klenkii]|uniref:hypothetical protein n=1 Tax=Streptomyces klenkii TaxID=1420899 RepID=UPI003442176D
MSRYTHKRICARVAAVLVAPVLSLGLLAPSASAATLADPLLPCEGRDGGFFCDANDIAGALSDLLNPVFQVTCQNPEANPIICRVQDGR